MKLTQSLSALASTGLLALSLTHPVQAEENNVLVRVNGTPINKEMFALYFQERLSNVPGTEITPEHQMTTMKELINITLIAKDAVAKKLDQKAEVAAAIELQKTQILTRIAVQNYTRENAPSEEDLRKAYESETSQKKSKEYKARHILLKTEEDAKKIIKELEGGADFSQMAKDHSTGPTGKNGGDLGWFDLEQMVPEFSTALATMKKGDYSKTAVKTQFGHHIILMEDMRETEPKTFEQARAELDMQLRRKSLNEYIASLHKNATITYNSDPIEKKTETKAENSEEKK